MALMSCPHCSHPVSERAVACPHCRASLAVSAAATQHLRADISRATSHSQRFVAPLAWMSHHPWLTGYAALGVLALPLLAYVATRPFDEFSEAMLAGYGSLAAVAGLWGGIWLAMPGTTRGQKWSSIFTHLGILLAILLTLWLLIAVPMFRYVAVAIALGAAGYGIYRFASIGASKPCSAYRWGVRVGYVIVFIGAVVHSVGDPVPATSTSQSLPPTSSQQRDARHYQLGGFFVIYAGLKVVERFARKACLAELDTRPVAEVSRSPQITSPAVDTQREMKSL